MTQTELLEQIEKWASSRGVRVEVDHEESAVEFHFNCRAGEWLCNILCETDPLMVHVICRLPVRVPEDKLTQSSFVLHALNAQIRMGSYSLDPESGTILFRLGMPLRPGEPIEEQLSVATTTACQTTSHHLSVLCLCLFDQPAVRQRLDTLLPGGQTEKALRPYLGPARAELN